MRFRPHIAIALLLGGCASTPEVRGLGDKTGVFVSSLDGGTREFVEIQNRLNIADARRIDTLAADGSQDRANVRQQRLSWTVAADNARLATHDSATSLSAEQVVAGIQSQDTSPEKVSASLEGYAKAQKALAEVAAKPKPGVALRELIGFGQEIYESYGKLRDAAQKDAEAGAAKP